MKLPREAHPSIGGGVKDGRAFKAVRTGSPSGGRIPAGMLDLPMRLSMEASRVRHGR